MSGFSLRTNRSFLLIALAGALAACGDDGGGDTGADEGSSGSAGTTSSSSSTTATTTAGTSSTTTATTTADTGGSSGDASGTEGSGTEGSGTGTEGSGSTGAQLCEPTDPMDECDVCVAENCCTELMACQDSADCACLTDCIAEMGADAVMQCMMDCMLMEAPAELGTLRMCTMKNCQVCAG